MPRFSARISTPDFRDGLVAPVGRSGGKLIQSAFLNKIISALDALAGFAESGVSIENSLRFRGTFVSGNDHGWSSRITCRS